MLSHVEGEELFPISHTNPWLFRVSPSPRSTVRLFCFPYAGGDAGIFRTWSDYLPSGIEVCAVRLPGRHTRVGETPFTRLDDLVQFLAANMVGFLDKPFALFGHSLGALISFELARHLRSELKQESIHLFVSAHRAPQLPSPNEPIHALPRDQFLTALRKLRGTPEEILDNEEFINLILPALRADFELCETYQHRPTSPFMCPISVFGGLEDTSCPKEMLEPWREHTKGTFVLRMLPGHHFFIRTAQHLILRVIAQELRSGGFI